MKEINSYFFPPLPHDDGDELLQQTTVMRTGVELTECGYCG